jgi:ribonuclease D
MIADPQVVKLVHAGGQDLQIFNQMFDTPANNVFDTQIAAAFLGYGHQAGLADLVKRVLDGPQLSKKFQFTDWAARPLSTDQIEYAMDDVRFLPRLHHTLLGELESRGRLSWARTEFHRAQQRACARVPADELYLRLNISGLSRRGLAVLRELAMVRDAIAREIDKPPGFIVSDLTMVQLAKHPPLSMSELRSTRGLPGMAERTARELLAAVTGALALPDDELPQRRSGERPDDQLDAVAAVLGVMVAARAADEDISRSYLAPRDQITALAGWWLRRDGSPEPDLPLLTDWRRELVGQELLDLLHGRLAIVLGQTAGESAIQTTRR